MSGGTKKEEWKAKHKADKKAMKAAKKEKLRQQFGETAPLHITVEAPVKEDSSEAKEKNKKRKAEDSIEKEVRTAKKSKKVINGESTVTEERLGASIGTVKTDNELQQDFMAFPKGTISSTKKRKAKERAEKPGKVEQDEAKNDKEARRQAKRERRAARKAEEAQKTLEAAANGASENSNKPEEKNVNNGTTTENGEMDKRTRYILFIGNIPHKATKEDLEKHFAKVEPLGIRLMTERNTGKSRGFAFMDFENDEMARACLKSYHHSHMQDGKQSRRINVELTAGGGGNSKDRKTKISTKNEALHAQRQRRHDHEEKKKVRADRKEQKNVGKASQIPNVDGAADTPSQPTSMTSNDMGIHPERLAQIRKRF